MHMYQAKHLQLTVYVLGHGFRSLAELIPVIGERVITRIYSLRFEIKKNN